MSFFRLVISIVDNDVVVVIAAVIGIAVVVFFAQPLVPPGFFNLLFVKTSPEAGGYEVIAYW